MGIVAKQELNPYFEILGLIYMGQNPEHIEKESIFAMLKARELDIDGEKLYQKFGGVLSRYVKAFQKKMILGEEDLFFFDDPLGVSSDNLIMALQVIFGNSPYLITDFEAIEEEELRLALMRSVCMVPQKMADAPLSFEQIIDLIDESGFSPNVCWKLARLMQQPKKYIALLSAIIEKNMPAYQSALSAIEKPLGKLLAEFQKTDFSNNEIYVLQPGEGENIVITPILIYPCTEMIDHGGNIYVGLYVQDIYKMLQKTKRAPCDLLPVFKALGDQNRLNALQLLKVSPMYNLELAEKLGLGASTTSHHMSVLLDLGLVYIEKHDGRVYYFVQKDNISKFIGEIQKTLL